jgi:UDP-glucose 4-epimerase
MWNNANVLVTGGASFIGSHLVDTLIEKGAIIRVADDFSSGSLSNLEYDFEESQDGVWRNDNLTVWKGDMKNISFTRKILEGIDVVFHLAASHGGRGYIDTHPADCSANMALDGIVFQESYTAGVERLCYASSACVYPSYLQEETGSAYLLTERDADPFVRDKAQADLEYGWAKLMGEMALKAYHKQYGTKAVSVRIFTAYGPRENETHAIIALIAKALAQMDPYVVWGSGEQDRNFTYVQDIVDAMILATEKITDGSPINAGRDDRITINEVIESVFDLVEWRPLEVERDLSKPQGVASRAADLNLARHKLKWEPKVGYREGFARTIEWYQNNKDITQIKANLEQLLMER